LLSEAQTKLKVYKIMAMPVALFGSDAGLKRKEHKQQRCISEGSG